MSGDLLFSKDDFKKIAQGCENISETDKGIEFERFTTEEKNLYHTTQIAERIHTPSGVQLVFKTDASGIDIEIEVEKVVGRSFFCMEIFCNSILTGDIKNFDEHQMTGFYSCDEYPLGRFFNSFEFPKGEKEIRIVMPWSVRTYIKRFVLTSASFFVPVTKNKKIIMYGDSITHGCEAAHPSKTYSVLLAEKLNAECFIKAVCGEKFFPELAKIKSHYTSDYITIAYGTNDFSERDKQRFDNNSFSFIKNISNNYKESKIFVISPIWRKDHDTFRKTNTVFDDFHYIENRLSDICKGFDNVNFISGRDLVPEDENMFGDLYLHPNDTGFDCYYNNLYKKIKKYINTQI